MRPSTPETEPSTGSVQKGSVLAGKYRVERALGKGGMGLVVAARHLQLGERVAVKLLLPRLAARPDATARFLREGRAAARIRSEHVARVHDAGTLPSGELFLVLEYLHGRDLRSEVEASGPLSVEVAVSYVLHACEGLAAAHALGIVHRDLKPANLFLTRRADGSPIVKIIDFGVSKIRSPGGGDLTESDVAIGTPHYMAPEQMRAARDVDARADIFSLGAVLHWLLTATLPFPGDTMVAVYDRQLAGPPPLSDALPAVPAALSAIVERCLRIRPDDRYPDVGALAAALSPFGAPWARLAAERAQRTSGEPPSTSFAEPDDPPTPGAPESEDGAATSGIRGTIQRESGSLGEAPGGTRTPPLSGDEGRSSRGSGVDAFGSTVCAGGPAPSPVTEPGREPTWLQERASPDTRSPDTHSADTHSPDTRSPDTRSPDTHSADTHSPDTRSPDTRSPDTRSPDTKLSGRGEPAALHAAEGPGELLPVRPTGAGAARPSARRASWGLVAAVLASLGVLAGLRLLETRSAASSVTSAASTGDPGPAGRAGATGTQERAADPEPSPREIPPGAVQYSESIHSGAMPSSSAAPPAKGARAGASTAAPRPGTPAAGAAHVPEDTPAGAPSKAWAPGPMDTPD